MPDIDAIRSRAGRLLYRELPEEYRYRDASEPGELGDLEAFLHGPGHLLDLIRATTEQAHADSFAEPVDGRSIQPWLLPYLAELLGAQLVAPDTGQRTAELNSTVGWYKSKGTLGNIDSIADVVAGTESAVREGWRMVAVTPRMNVPPFTAPPEAPGTAALVAEMAPRGCPDMRVMSRAVQDPDGSGPMQRLRPRAGDPEGKTLFWRALNPGGLPCFPGHYDDMSVRTPDLRDPARTARPGPHPRRTMIHMRPPEGMFASHLPVLTLNTAAKVAAAFPMEENGVSTFAAADLCAANDLPPSDRLVVKLTDHFKIPSGLHRFDGILFTGRKGGNPIRFRLMEGAQVELTGCAVEKVSVNGSLADAPSVIARDSLLGEVLAPDAWVQLEYVTVAGTLDAKRLHASDCILADLADTLTCDDAAGHCIRYSAIGRTGLTPGTPCAEIAAPGNTRATPEFLRLWIKDGDSCTLRPAAYGKPGYGVLDTTTPAAIASRAEDDGEMGAHHGHHHLAAIRALDKKLRSFLPFGQEVALAYDPLLALDPPVMAED
ncbi:hypothetical protein [Mesobacterium pallidum]|uniref:hypothetical protein n=1 Tax=Mesobacterium pallidum TaxID=2872037 RepID=UPI001EE22F46|nr:hypothetical protein [Mesobacterium pallidum]